jgi:hypothetical protein
MAERRDARYERAAARFAARVVIERRLTASEGHRDLALPERLPKAPSTLGEVLRQYCAIP